MENSVTCSVCLKPLMSNGGDFKKAKMCSASCGRNLQYLLGLAHGVILLNVLDKLCGNVFDKSCQRSLTYAASHSLHETEGSNFNGGGVHTDTEFSKSNIKTEAEAGGPEDSVTDVKVSFDNASEREQVAEEVQEETFSSFSRDQLPPSSSPVSGQTPSKRKRKGCSALTESGCLPSKRTRTSDSAKTVSSASAPRRTRASALAQSESGRTLSRRSYSASPSKTRTECLSSESEGVQCRWCGEKFPTGEDMAEHLTSCRSKQSDHNCDICGAVFEEKKLLQLHKKSVHCKNTADPHPTENRSYVSDELDEDFSASDDLQQPHKNSCAVSKQDDKQNTQECDVCGESFKNKSQLTQHTATKHQTEQYTNGQKAFWCDKCNKQYPTKQRLQRHKQFVHSKQTAEDCSVCGKTFRNKLLLKHHVQFMHSKQTPCDCKVCGKTYRNAHLLKMHLKVVHKVKIINRGKQEQLLQCALCPEIFSAAIRNGITSHQTECHSMEVPSCQEFSCSICGARFKRKIYLVRHEKKAHSVDATIKVKGQSLSKNGRDQKRYPCDKCGKTYTQSALSKHIRVYHSTQDPVDCDICGKTLFNAFHLEQHKRQHAPTRICHICGTKFKTDAGLQGHLAAHRGAKSHICDICGVGFVRKTSWQRHVKIHSKTITFQCDTCPKTFTTVYSLNTHMLAKHHRGAFFNNRLKTLEDVGYSVDREATDRHSNHQCIICSVNLVNGMCPAHPTNCMLTFKCSYCEVVVKHVDDLCQHLKTHNIPLAFTASTGNYTVGGDGKRDDTDVDFTCRVCHKQFQRRENLAGHMKQHKEKAFTCHICFKKFTYKCNMQNHLRTHSDDKPFQCEVCNKAFKYKQLLNNHRLVHNLSESPFKCQLCGKGLTRKFFLQRHYRQMHPGVTV